MLALVVAVALSQCTKDTDCKGSRVCQDGACVGDAPAVAPPVAAPSLEPLAEVVARERVRILKVSRLESEMRELHDELADTSLVAPIFKLVGATVFTGLSIWSGAAFSDYADCTNRNLRYCGNGSTLLGLFIGSTVAAVVLYVWGGLQLRLRVNALQRLPEEIELKAAELAALKAQR